MRFASWRLKRIDVALAGLGDRVADDRADRHILGVTSSL
jgi:hypothetical protein